MSKCFVLITGAAKRIGKEIAIYFANKGYNIIVHYNKSKIEAEQLINFLKTNYSIDSLAIQANFNIPEDIQNIFSVLNQKAIYVNVLVNSASSFHFDNLFSYNKFKWEENFNTNLKAPYLLSMEYVKYIKNFTQNTSNLKTSYISEVKKKDIANIINIVDSWSCNVDSRFLSYNLAKLALWRLTEIMALELAPLIRVNGIALGLTMKPDTMNKEKFKELYNITPLAKPVDPLHISKTIEFILKNQSLCGEIIKVDCGKSLIGNKILTNL